MTVACEDFDFVISDEAFAYLAIQKGGLDHLTGDRAAWEAAYKDQIFTTYESLLPYLPTERPAILDVGGGMSGISAVLNRHYGGQAQVIVIDGEADAPEVRLHRETFNDMRVTEDFLAANGVGEFTSLSPPLRQGGGRPWIGLVLSFGAWCFHFEPSEYLDFVKRRLKPGGTVILEVRRGKPSWLGELCDAFGKPELICRAGKYDRFAFRA